MRIAAPAFPRPRLDVRDLELVLAIAAAGSTVHASASLHLTQSAVSRGLRLAEEKLGLRLFDRTVRGLSPTPAGRRLIDGAGAVLAQLLALEASAETPLPESVRVRIACECYTAYHWLPATLADLQQTVPPFEVTIVPEHSYTPVAALLAGELDVALLTTSPLPAGRALVEVPLFRDELILLVSSGHPLARAASLTRRDLTAYPLIASSQTSRPEQTRFLSQVFGRSRPKLAYLRFPLTEVIVAAARAGQGIAVLSEWIAAPYLEGKGLVRKRLAGKPIERPWRLAFRRESKDAALRLGAALRFAPPRAPP